MLAFRKTIKQIGLFFHILISFFVKLGIRICKGHDNVETQETRESVPFLCTQNQHTVNELEDDGTISLI